MQRALFTVVFVFLFCLPALAKDTYHIEVLQVSKINPFDWSYQGFVSELAKNGIVQGKNLVINRHVIDADAEAGIVKKIFILLKIKSKASEIIASKPDLVLTISTPATKYGKDAFIAAGIPVVFTGVAVPQAAGCASLTKAGTGFTGASLRMDPLSAMRLTRHALPKVTTMGIVHTDDENAVAFVEEAKEAAKSVGMTIITKQVKRSDNIKPAAQELIAKGAQAFGLPIDTYYAVKNYQHALELREVVDEAKIPCICYCHVGFSGALLYMGSEFETVGELSGAQAAKILLTGVKPETLPVQYQKGLTILADEGVIKRLGINVPLDLLQIAKKVNSEKK
jgi:putative tryptophan/tyrosine transport system substrate-binding protein